MAERLMYIVGPAWQSLAFVVLLGLLFAMSALLERSGPVRLRHWAQESGGRLRKLYETRPRFTVYRLLLSFLAKVVPLALFLEVQRLSARLGMPWATGWALLAVAAVTAAAELGNRRLVDHAAESALRRLTWLYRAFYALVAVPMTLLAPLVPAAVTLDEDEDEASDEEIEAFIDFGTREGILEPGEGDMVWGIVDFADTEARSVMTPRIDIACASADADLETLAERFLDSGHSRIPLYEESIDRIVGVLHIRDLLRGLRSDPRPSARELAKPPLVVPETRRLDGLLRQMQSGFQQLAIVVDEYGGTAGLVTVEDLLEEIVGEIVDEHETQEPEPEPLPGGGWRLDGRTPVDTLDDLFGVDLEEEPYETVGGLILSEVGSVPELGEEVVSHGLLLVVEQVEDRRIQMVRVERLLEPEAEENDARARD